MPKILIRSRGAIEQMDFAPKTALISITDYGWTFAKLKSEPDHILKLAFDDVDGDIFVDTLGRNPTDNERVQIEKKFHMLTDEQANQIAEFYHSVRDDVEIIICQCEHGQSRSAAVAAAILEYRSRSGIKVFASDKYYPNKVVFNKVLKAIAR